MNQPAIKKLVRLSLLERVSPELLVRFLRPYEDFLEPRGVVLDTEDQGKEWVARIHEVLTRVDPALPGKLQQALVDVTELASAEGEAQARALVGERQLGLFALHEELSREDLAFTLFLENTGSFGAARDRIKALSARRFRSSFPRVHLPMTGHLTESKRVLLASKARRWFGARNRSEYISVTPFEERGEVFFLFGHGQQPRSQRVVTSIFSVDRISFMPDREDTVIFDQTTGKLSVSAQFPAEQDFYRRLIGLVFFGDDGHFEPSTELTAAPLIEDIDGALSPDGIAGLEAVRLQKIVLESTDAPFDKLRWEADDLRKVMKTEIACLLHRPRAITHFVLALQVAGHRAPKVVKISPPSTLSYDQRWGKDVVQDCLLSRGYMTLPPALAEQIAV